MLASTFTLGAAIANSPIDQYLQNGYQENIRSNFTNDLTNFWRPQGQTGALYTQIAIGAFATITSGTKAGDFSKELFFKSTRAFIVGTIPLHLMKLLTGGSRPINSKRSSYWKPFTLRHGVSGDTYTGAILFITLAKMVDNLYLKSFLYTASTFAGIGRINDECHYPSQVFLGWMMAYAAVESVWKSDSNFNLSIQGNQIAFAFEF